MADPKIQISIGAVVDASLLASTGKAKDQIDRIADAQERASSAVADAFAKQTDAQTKEGQKQVDGWKKVCGEILSAEGQLVADIFSKRQSLAVDLEKIGLRLAESEVANALKTLTAHEMANLGMLTSDKATAQEGLLYKLGVWLAEQAAFTASEAAKTAAAIGGAAARQGVESAAKSMSLAEQAASKAQVIASDADQAASGAYSSASQIPYVGWLIAPAAAATAAAAVMAYAEGGQLRVASAEQPTMLHKDEMVWAAHGARAMLASFSAGDFNVPKGGDTFHRSQSDVTTHHWNYAPTIHGVAERDVMDELRNNAAEFASFVRGLSRGGSMRFG